MNIGDRLQRARKEAKLGQQAAAEQLGYSGKAGLSALERGANSPSAEMLARMADLYDVSADYLLGRQEKMRPDYQGLTKAHVAAARTIATLPKPLQQNVLGLIDGLRPLADNGILQYVLNYDTNNPDQERMMQRLREAQAEYRKSLDR